MSHDIKEGGFYLHDDGAALGNVLKACGLLDPWWTNLYLVLFSPISSFLSPEKHFSGYETSQNLSEAENL